MTAIITAIDRDLMELYGTSWESNIGDRDVTGLPEMPWETITSKCHSDALPTAPRAHGPDHSTGAGPWLNSESGPPLPLGTLTSCESMSHCLILALGGDSQSDSYSSLVDQPERRSQLRDPAGDLSTGGSG